MQDRRVFVLSIAVFVAMAAILVYKSEVAEAPQPGQIRQFTNIKIGNYTVADDPVVMGVKLEYKGTIEAQTSSQIYQKFSEIYPELVNNKNDFYIKGIIIDGDTAEVYFGGDENVLTNQSGSSGAAQYGIHITAALTEDPRITKVDFKLQYEGSHFGPGIYTREQYKSLIPEH